MADKKRLKQILAADHPELLPLLEEEKPDEFSPKLVDILNKVTLLKGEPGETPTDERLLELIEPRIPEPIPGKDYILTEEDKTEIAAQIEVPIVKQIVERTETVREIPIVKEVAVKDTPKQLVAKLNTLEGALEVSVIKDVPSFEDFLTRLRKEKSLTVSDLKDGQSFVFNNTKYKTSELMHGGGISNITGLITAGTNITITGSGTSSDPYIINSSGGGGTPAAPVHSIQYNNPLGTFAGDSAFIRDITDATSRYGMKVGAVTGATNNWNIWSGSSTVTYDPFTLTDFASNVFNNLDSKPYGLTVLNTITAASAANGIYQAIVGGTTLVGIENQAYLAGFEGDVYHHGTGTVDLAIANVGGIFVDNGGTITVADHVAGGNATVSGAGSTIVTLAALHAYNTVPTSSGAVTNLYGLLIDPQTGGSAFNWNLVSGSKIASFNSYITGAGLGGYFAASNVLNSLNIDNWAGASFINQNNGGNETYGAFFIAQSTSATATFVAGGYSEGSHGGTGTSALNVGHLVSTANVSSGTITNNRSLSVISAINSGGGVISNNYGIYVEDQTVGVNNYAIRTGAGQVRFGGNTSPLVNDGSALGTTALQWSDLFLAEGGVINWDNGDATLTQVGNVLTLAGADFVADNITANTAFLPDANDGAALGTTALQFSDLFLAEGGVINWDNGDATLTQTGNVVAFAGADLQVATAGVGTNADSVPTLSSTSTLTNKTLTAPTIGGTASLADAATISLIVPTADGTATGNVTSAFVSGYTSSAIGDLVILDSNGKWQKTDANTASIYNGLLGIALAVAATDAALKVALPGSIVYATAFPTMTIGATMYMSETAGAITATAPTTTDSATRVIGYAVHADKIFFFPSGIDYTTHT